MTSNFLIGLKIFKRDKSSKIQRDLFVPWPRISLLRLYSQSFPPLGLDRLEGTRLSPFPRRPDFRHSQAVGIAQGDLAANRGR